MNAKQRVPVTVAVLTYTSSIATVEATIRSVAEFDEVLVCDGGSTDGTRELATSMGCRVIDQDPAFLDERGRLIDEAGVLSQMLIAATHPWVFFLDHDELASPELVEEMRVISTSPRRAGAYRIPRLYTLDAAVIDRASVYPRFQVRLLHRDAVAGFAGIVHSVPNLHEGEETLTAEAAMLVPQPRQREMWPKWRGYLRLEEASKADLSLADWRATVLRPQLRSAQWIAYRTIKVRRVGGGTCLPLRYELSRIAYELAVIWYTGRRFLHLGNRDPRKAWR